MGFEVKKNKGEKPEEKKREKKDKGCRMNNFDATTHRKPPLKKRKRILSEEESQYHKLKTQQATHIKISSPRSPLLLVYTCNIYIYTYMFNLFKKKTYMHMCTGYIQSYPAFFRKNNGANIRKKSSCFAKHAWKK